MNFIPFSFFVILIFAVGILERKEEPTKYLKVVSIGLLYLRMHIIFANHMKNTKEQTISLHKNQMPLTNIFINETFYVWGIDFMGSFISSFGNLYILLVVDYVPKWIKVKTTLTSEAKVVLDFVKTHIFDRFGNPKATISDHDTHFCNRAIEALLYNYHVTHWTFAAYHPQTNGQTKISNREIKSILEKTMQPN